MREHDDEITRLGTGIVAIGTGDQRYAEAFVRDEQIPFLVLVDDEAAAAQAASLRTLNWFQLLHPDVEGNPGNVEAGTPRPQVGKRVKQIGATFVIGAGDRVRFEHLDATARTTRGWKR